MGARLGGQRGRLRDERFCLGEGGAVAHRAEQLCRPAEWLFRGRVFKCDQATALAEKRVGVLADVPELLPAPGSFAVERCRIGVVASVFGELGAGGAEGVLAGRVAGLEPVREPLGKVGVVSGERSPQHRPELSGVVGDVTGTRRLLDLGEERARLIGCAGGEPGGCDGREHLDGCV